MALNKGYEWLERLNQGVTFYAAWCGKANLYYRCSLQVLETAQLHGNLAGESPEEDVLMSDPYLNCPYTARGATRLFQAGVSSRAKPLIQC